MTPYAPPAWTAFPKVYSLLLPPVEVVLATPYPCHSCMGYRLDFRAAKSTAAGLQPCPVCANRGARLPGETAWVDAAASPPDAGYVSVLARMRSPFPGRDGWWTRDVPEGQERGMETSMASVVATGATALRVALARAAAGTLQANGALVAASMALPVVEWPAGWSRASRVHQTHGSNLILARLDGVSRD